MAKTQKAAAPATKAEAAKDAVVKGGAGKSKTRTVPAGTLTGPGGAKLVEQGDKHAVTEEQRKGERRQSQDNAIAKFANSQMQTPAAHELTEEQKRQAAMEAEIAEIAKKYGLPAPAVAAKAPRARTGVQQNGITRPGAETTCGLIWKIADEISVAQSGAPAQISQLKAHTALKQVNDHTIKTQYARWRQFHGVKGRLQVVQVPTVAGEDAGLEAASLNRRATDQAA